MAFAAVAWAYKDEAVAVKLAQMVENTQVHDHRADGSQGAPMVSDWVDITGVVAAGPGFGLLAGATQRYRLLLGGKLVEYDFAVTRTGADLVAANDGSSRPGNLPDADVVTGIPAAAVAGVEQRLVANGGGTICLFYTTGAQLKIEAAGTSGRIIAGDQIRIRGVLWRV